MDQLGYRWDDNVTGGVTVVYTSEGAGTVEDWSGSTDTFVSVEAIQGTEFDDSFTGSDGDDELRGDEGNDIFNGGAGDDEIQAGSGSDTIDGGTGFDRLNYHWGEDTQDGLTVSFTGEGAGTAVEWNGDTDTFTGIEQIHGTVFDDTMNGSEFNETLIGEEGNDILNGNGGADSLRGGEGDDQLNGGAGDDYIQAGSGADTINGGEGWDFLAYEWEEASNGITVNYTSADGGTLTDHTGATDTFTGIEGMSGTEYVDIFNGGSGDDTFRGAGGADTINGGDGNDWVFYHRDIRHGATQGIVADLSAGSVIDGYGATDIITSIENVSGSEFNDTIFGNSVANTINGNDGNDTLSGREGDDILNGGVGEDILDGGLGADELYGGVGADTFVFSADGGSDVVHDFEIDLDVIDVRGLTSAQFSVRASGFEDTEIFGANGESMILKNVLVDDITSTNLPGITFDGITLDHSTETEDINITGGLGGDTITSGSGDDTIESGSGDDIVDAGAGDDVIYDYLGDDTIDAGDGNDSVILLTGSNTANGGAGSDALVGGIQDDVLSGGEGYDVIKGDAGSGLYGGSDTITGGVGDDTMMGGLGADVFVFSPNEGIDTIGAFDMADLLYDAVTGYSVTATGADYEVGIDHIQLEGFVGVDETNVMNSVTAGVDGANFEAEGTQITFYGIDAASLTTDDFLFI